MTESSVLERVRTRVAVPLLEWLAPPAVYPEPSMRLRAQVFGAATGLILLIGTIRAVVFAATGALWVALGFVAIGGSGGVYLLCVRRGLRLSVIVNAFAGQLFLVLMATSVFRGGVGSLSLVCWACWWSRWPSLAVSGPP